MGVYAVQTAGEPQGLLASAHHHDADSLPGLEIEANDVKCSHGATTGQVSPEELFYLRARGIPLAVAQELLAQGFLEEVLIKISNDATRELIRERLREKFHRS